MRASRYLLGVLAIAALGAWLRAPALSGSLLADDWDHYAMSVGIYPVPRSAFDLYDFVSRDANERRALLAAGRLPWWSSPELELAVLRPLSSALLSLDYRVLDAAHAPFRAHLHSLAWWLLVISAVAALLRRVLPARLAWLALAFFALDEAHGLPVTWIANRNALVAIGLASFGLFAHVARRRGVQRVPAWLAPTLIALALLAGEHAFAVLGYFVAFEIIGSSEATRERLRALAPYFALALAFVALRFLLGYGVAGSGFYIDPLGSPLRYARALCVRLPVLLADLVLGLRAEWYAGGAPFLEPGTLSLAHQRALTLALGYAVLFAISVALLRTRRAARDSLVTEARWLVLGALLALLPVCSTVPMTRLTLASAIGIDAALALVLAGAWRTLWSGTWLRRLGASALASAIVAVHGVLAALHSRDEAAYFAARSHLEEAAVASAMLDDGGLERRAAFVIATSSQTTAWALPYVRELHSHPMPASTTLLSAEQVRPLELRRTGPRTLELRVIGGPLPASYVGSVYRADDATFAPGELVHAAQFEVRIIELREGQPVRTSFTFPRALDDPSYVFLYPFRDGLRAIEPLGLGESRVLPPPAS